MYKVLVCTLLLITSSQALYAPCSNVVELTPSNFDQLVLYQNDIWLVQFFTSWCSHCITFSQEYSNAADRFKGIARVGTVDADKYPELKYRFGVTYFPTVKIFGNDKNRPSVYAGERTVQGLMEVILDVIKTKLGNEENSVFKSDVVRLTDSNFHSLVLNSKDMWVVNFYAPWCAHCLNLEPRWARLAAELKGKVNLGSIDATNNLQTARQYNVKSYPTIKVFSTGLKTYNSVKNYDGDISYDVILDWILNEHEESKRMQVFQLINETIFRDNCKEKSFCIVAFLPKILKCDLHCRQNYIYLLTDLAKQFYRKNWGWFWSEERLQPELEKALNITSDHLPIMAVIDPKRLKYVTLNNLLSVDNVKTFLNSVLQKRDKMRYLNGDVLPRIYAVASWKDEKNEDSDDEGELTTQLEDGLNVI